MKKNKKSIYKKNILILFLFQFIYLFGLSQTKLETENWIKSKINKWSKTNSETIRDSHGFITYGYSEEPKNISFNNCVLSFSTINYTYNSTTNEKNLYHLNIGDIEQIEWVEDNGKNYLVFSTKNKNVKKSITILGSFKSDQPEVKIEYVNGIVISIDIDGEENLKNRLLKALNHLQSFCSPSKIEKEVF